MTTVTANVPVDLSSKTGVTNFTFDDYALLVDTVSQVVFRYTQGGSPVMDISLGGTFYSSTYSVYGRITSVVVSQPGIGTAISFEGMNLTFSSVSGLLNALNLTSWLSGADRIYGSGYSDVLYGYDGNDFISAGPGNDTIDGGSGSDTIDGGDGVDIVIRNHRYLSNQLVQYGGQVVVMDSYNSKDILTNVEYIRFSDSQVAASSARSFDAMAYLAANRDLANLYGANGSAAFNHYINSGYTENRPTTFDGLSYLAANPDLIRVFGTDTTAATAHYVNNGRRENRPTGFNASGYLAAYTDLKRAFGNDTQAATVHYILNGFNERRTVPATSARGLMDPTMTGSLQDGLALAGG